MKKTVYMAQITSYYPNINRIERRVYELNDTWFVKINGDAVELNYYENSTEYTVEVFRTK